MFSTGPAARGSFASQASSRASIAAQKQFLSSCSGRSSAELERAPAARLAVRAAAMVELDVRTNSSTNRRHFTPELQVGFSPFPSRRCVCG